MSDLVPSSPNPNSKSKTTSPADLIWALNNSSSNDFYGIALSLRVSGAEVGSRAEPDQKNQIFFSLLRSAVCLRTENGSEIGPAISGAILCDVLKYFDPADYCNQIAHSEREFLKELEQEDLRRTDIDPSAPKIFTLAQHSGCIRDVLIFSLGHLMMSQPASKLTKAAESLIREISESEQFKYYGSSRLVDIFSKIENPGLLGDVGRMCLSKTFAHRIADYLKMASESVLSGEFDRSIVQVQKLFFAKFLEKILEIKNSYIKAEKSWSQVSNGLNAGYGKNAIVSGPEDFIAYIFTFGALNHVVQPALAAVCRDMEGRPVGETAKATLNILLNNSDQGVSNIMSLDWDSIYAHAQLDYSFNS